MNLREELSFIIDSTVDLKPKDYDRDTLLMRLESCIASRCSALRTALERARVYMQPPPTSGMDAMKSFDVHEAFHRSLVETDNALAGYFTGGPHEHEQG